MKYPPYKIQTDRLVIRCYNPYDAQLLKETVDKKYSILTTMDAMGSKRAYFN